MSGGFVLFGLGVGRGVGVGAGVGEIVREDPGGDGLLARGFGCGQAPPMPAAGLGLLACEGAPAPSELRTGQSAPCWGTVAETDGALPGATCMSASRTAPPITTSAAATANITRLMRDQRCPDAS